MSIKNHLSAINKSGLSHDEQHTMWSRRNFLQTIGITGGMGLTMSGFSLSALASSPLLLTDAGKVNDRILVLIRMKGGNDGLNTIIPLFDYSTYKSNRPTIAIPNNGLVGLDTDGKYGIPSSFAKAKRLWDDGAMKVIHSVGYPDHNLSHFTSGDIWNTANIQITSDEDKSGWLGRYILNERPDFLENLPEIPAAIKVSSGSNIAYQNADKIDLAVNFNTPDKLIEVAQKGFLYDTANLPDNCYYGDQVGFLRSILNVTFKYAPAISQAYTRGKNDVSYSNNELSRQLAIVARLIKGNLGTRLYMVNLDGFDTHENQNTSHPKLMNALSTAVSEFYEDLAISQRAEEVLSLTFSEFGRRVKENNGGTDHGTAAPIMMFGPALSGNGYLGDDPDMKNLDNNGNMIATTDFRSVYASVLESWLCLDAMTVDQLLGGTFERVGNLGFSCTNVGSSDLVASPVIQHQIRPDGQGGYLLKYSTSRPGPVKIDIFTIMGQKLNTVVNAYHSAGTHEVSFGLMNGISASLCIYQITSGKVSVSGKFVAFD